MYVQTDGIVLRETRYKDSDKILTVLTRSEGLATVKAAGALRRSSKFTACSQLLAYSELTLFAYKDRFSLNEAALLDTWLPLRDDLTRMTMCAYAAELCEALAPEGVPCDEMLELLRLLLYRACYKEQPEALLKAAFEAAMMVLCGYAPDLSGCAVCDEVSPVNPLLALSQGVVVCSKCREHYAEGIAMPLSEGGLAALRFIADCEVGKVFSFKLADEELRQFAQAVEAYVHTHLERGFGALDFYKKL